jgi:hypothetical protein
MMEIVVTKPGVLVVLVRCVTKKKEIFGFTPARNTTTCMHAHPLLSLLKTRHPL